MMKARKSLICIFAVLFLVFGTTPGFSYTVHFAMDGSFDFDHLDGFQIYTTISGLDVGWEDELTVYYPPAGAVPVEGWNVSSLATLGGGSVLYVDGYRYEVGGNVINLGPGMVFSLDYNVMPFTIFSIDLIDNTREWSQYDPDAYYIVESTYQGSPLYTAYGTAAVPIPAAAWLLGSGLLGFVAIRRRMRK